MQISKNKLEIDETEKGNWSAFYTGTDGSGNWCFEEEAHNIFVRAETEAIEQAKMIWGIIE